MKQLAVIMSVYKNDKLETLTLAIDSILNQSYYDFDFFIQADGELDETIEEYLDKHSDVRIKFNKRKENKGLAFSLNEMLQIILEKKTYTYVARMDADDISLSERFEKQINFLQKNDNIDVVGTWAIEIDGDGNEFFKKEMPITHEECRKLFIVRDCLIHPTVMFRVSYFHKAGLYPTDTFFAEDTKMWQQGFMNNCKFANLPDFLLKFRLDSNFFDRRRGWEYAKSIYLLRASITKEMNYGVKGYLYAILYALAKLMPTQILSLIYKNAR